MYGRKFRKLQMAGQILPRKPKEAELEAAKKDAKELRAGFDIENQKYNTKKVKRTKTAKGVKNLHRSN